MRVHVITTCDYQGGSLQHAVDLARAFGMLGWEARLVNVRPPTPFELKAALRNSGVALIEDSHRNLSDVDLSLVVDLLEQPCRDAARWLAQRRRRLFLVPTGYLSENPLPDFPGQAECILFVSWDQAISLRPYWHLAQRFALVRCAVDVNHFMPPLRQPSGHPWTLCRHSRDVPEKFAGFSVEIVDRIARTHEVRCTMLGAVEVLGPSPRDRIKTYVQGSLNTLEVLQQADMWLYAHASYWRESACIAILEAQACGLPVVVTNAGGMREYMRHGETGFLCNDADEFVHFAQLLFDTPELYRSMRTQARCFVRKYYSLESLARRLGDVLQIR